MASVRRCPLLRGSTVLILWLTSKFMCADDYVGIQEWNKASQKLGYMLMDLPSNYNPVSGLTSSTPLETYMTICMHRVLDVELAVGTQYQWLV